MSCNETKYRSVCISDRALVAALVALVIAVAMPTALPQRWDRYLYGQLVSRHQHKESSLEVACALFCCFVISSPNNHQ